MKTLNLRIDLKYKKEFSEIFAIIQKYKKIAIFRHIHPDFDALGSTWGLREFINDNFLNRDIRVLGDNHDDFTPRLYPKTTPTPNSWFNEPFLAIILDTPRKKRVADPRFLKAEVIIKIDHHQLLEQIGLIDISEDQCSSASELIANMIFYYNGKVSEKCAKYLYTGIVGDTGRFEYGAMSEQTYKIAGKLTSIGFDLTETYQKMYIHNQNDLKVIAYILENYKVSPHGVAYYILERKDLEKFKVTTSQAKDHVNAFHYVEGIHIWCAIAADQKENVYRASMRSSSIDLRDIAKKYQGGGHPCACGARLFSHVEIEQFIQELDSLIKK